MKNVGASNNKNSGILWLLGFVASVVAGMAGIPVWGALLAFGLFGVFIILPVLGTFALGGFIGTVAFILGEFVFNTFLA